MCSNSKQINIPFGYMPATMPHTHTLCCCRQHDLLSWFQMYRCTNAMSQKNKTHRMPYRDIQSELNRAKSSWVESTYGFGKQRTSWETKESNCSFCLALVFIISLPLCVDVCAFICCCVVSSFPFSTLNSSFIISLFTKPHTQTKCIFQQKAAREKEKQFEKKY